MNENPYEAPSSPVETPDVAHASPDVIATAVDVDPACDGVWRDGRYLIARHGVARFPARCIVCGREDGCQPMSCKIRRRPGLLQFLVPITGIFSDSVTVRPSVCTRHRTEERTSRRVGHAMLLLAIAMVGAPLVLDFGGADVGEGVAILAALALPLGWVWAYYRIFRSRIVWAKQIRKRDAWIEGVHQSVLHRVPVLPTAEGV
jgi:hypothetical protein